MYMHPLEEIHWVVLKHLKLPDPRSNQVTAQKRGNYLSLSQGPLFLYQENNNEVGCPGEIRDQILGSAMRQ